ncbi:MAG: MFS transporter [Defluviitaleaceae bacterium]|nr:MFS transporter [Defluviitaleaceae bacterium]
MRRIRLPKINPAEIPQRVKSSVSEFSQEMKRLRGTNVWIFIMYGLLFDMVNNLWRPFSVRFLERLGGGEFEISLLTALPGAVAAVVLLPGAIIFRKFTDKKRATAVFILISRAALLAVAFIPALPAELRPMLFVIFVAIMNCPDALSQTSLQSFLGTVFHGNLRGQAIALRTKFGQAVIPFVTIAAGLAITFIPNTDEQRMVLYQIFFVMAFLLGVVEVIIFNRLKVPEFAATLPPQAQPEAKSSVFKDLGIIIKDKRFRTFCVPAIIFMFTWQAGWPLVNIYQVINLGASELWFAIFALVSGLTAFFSGTFWQRLLRKRGNTIAFVASASILAGNMFMFPFIPNVQLLAVVMVFTGFSAVGINTALLNGVLEATPDENRLMYLAFYNTAQNISLFLSPFFVYQLLSLIGLTNAMLVVGGLRVLATAFVWFKMRDAKKATAT